MASSIGSTRATASASLSKRSGLRRPARMVFDTRSPSMTARGVESSVRQRASGAKARRQIQGTYASVDHWHRTAAIEAGHTDLSTPKGWSKTSSEKLPRTREEGHSDRCCQTSRDERTELCQNSGQIGQAVEVEMRAVARGERRSPKDAAVQSFQFGRHGPAAPDPENRNDGAHPPIRNRAPLQPLRRWPKTASNLTRRCRRWKRQGSFR